MKRVHVALNPPRRVNDFVVFAKVIASRLSEDPLFFPPAGVLATLESQVAALEAALVAVLTRRFGAAAERKARQNDVHGSLKALQAYVQSLADACGKDEAAMVVARAGMDLKDAKGPTRAALAVKPGRVLGSVHAYVKAAKTRAAYEWQIRHDGGEWTGVPFTVRADAELLGLSPGTVVSVRARAVTADGPSDWLAPVSTLVG